MSMHVCIRMYNTDTYVLCMYEGKLVLGEWVRLECGCGCVGVGDCCVYTVNEVEVMCLLLHFNALLVFIVTHTHPEPITCTHTPTQ